MEDDACPHCGLYSRPDLGGEWARNPVYNVCGACVPEVSKTRPVEYWIRQVMARECIAKDEKVQECGGRYVLGYV